MRKSGEVYIWGKL